jgi:hypothetical protein
MNTMTTGRADEAEAILNREIMIDIDLAIVRDVLRHHRDRAADPGDAIAIR